MKQAGFTLIELMITVFIIGILAAIAIPSYQRYTRKAYYVSIVRATAPYKMAVELCEHRLGTLTGCSAGSYNIPASVSAPVGAVAALNVIDGVIDNIQCRYRSYRGTNTSRDIITTRTTASKRS